MQVFDASSIILAWDRYPRTKFPPLWNWLGQEVQAGEIALSQVAFDETEQNSKECAQWLRENAVQRLAVTDQITAVALEFKELLEIEGEAYHPKGVDENDLLIIATAKTHGAPLTSEEEKQINLPDSRRKYRIPAVCRLPEVDVVCIDFVKFFNQSDEVFG